MGIVHLGMDLYLNLIFVISLYFGDISMQRVDDLLYFGDISM